MTMNSIEHKIIQLLKDGHTEQQVIALIELPATQSTAILKRFSEHRKLEKARATNQHNQAIYAMNL